MPRGRERHRARGCWRWGTAAVPAGHTPGPGPGQALGVGSLLQPGPGRATGSTREEETKVFSLAWCAWLVGQWPGSLCPFCHWHRFHHFHHFFTVFHCSPPVCGFVQALEGHRCPLEGCGRHLHRGLSVLGSHGSLSAGTGGGQRDLCLLGTELRGLFPVLEPSQAAAATPRAHKTPNTSVTQRDFQLVPSPDQPRAFPSSAGKCQAGQI